MYYIYSEKINIAAAIFDYFMIFFFQVKKGWWRGLWVPTEFSYTMGLSTPEVT